MHAKTTAAIDAMCEALDEDPSAPEKLMAALRGALGIGSLEESVDLAASLGRLRDMQRTLGMVEGFIEIMKKADRISDAYIKAGKLELAEAFTKFSVRLGELGEKRAAPISKAADQIRAARREGLH